MKKFPLLQSSLKTVATILLILCSIKVSFWLMNQKDTIVFMLGILMFITSIVAPIDYLYNKYKTKK